MSTLRPFVCFLLAILLITPPLPAQEQTIRYSAAPDTGFFSRLTRNYRPSTVPPIRLGNSNRLEALLRGGRLYLSLQDAIALALENSLDIELSRYGPIIAEVDLKRAQAGGLLRGVPSTIQRGASSAQAQVLGLGAGGGGGGGGGGVGAGGTIITATGTSIPNLDPVIFSGYTWGHRTSPQANTVTTGLTAVTFDNHSMNHGVSKGFLTGTTVSFGWNTDHVSNNNPRGDLNPFTQANFQLSITQKLLQGFGRAVNNRNIRIATNSQRVSDLVFEQQVIATVASVLNLYWDLVSFNADLDVKRKALSLAEKLYSDNKKQVEIGTLAQIEIVSAEAQVARRQQELLASETQLLQQEAIIKNALSRIGVASPTLADARIVPTDVIRIPEKEPIRPIQDLVELALAARPDIAQTRINIESSKIGLEGSRSQLKPSLDLDLNLQNNGLAGSSNNLLFQGQPVPRNVDPYFLGGFGTTMGQLFRRNFPNYSVGFSLNIPVGNRSAQADWIRDQLELRQSEIRAQQQINQVRVDVQNALIALQQARARYDAAVKERVLQEQTLDAEQKKYALGASTVFMIIQYQRDLAQAQSSEVTALAAYAKARVSMDQVTGQTLQANNIAIDEARRGQVSRPPDPPPPEP
jgi:outer membrane protein